MEMFTYKEVERALAAVHQISPSAMGAFRGRIKHFQRLGLVPSSPGKGRKISYRLEDVYVWAVRKYWVFYPNFLSQWYDDNLWNAKTTFVEDLSEITEGRDPISEPLKSRMAVVNLARLRQAVRKALEV